MLKKLFLITLALSLILIATYGCTASSAQELKLKAATLQIKQAVQVELDILDLNLSTAATELSRTGLSGTGARNVLTELTARYPFIIDTCTTDPAGKMVTVAPDAYSKYEGTDISTQSVTIEFNKTKKPMLSQMFPAVEGMNAVVLMWPIVSQNGDFIGSVSTLFQPETLFAPPYELLKGTGISIDVMQLDGLNLYDSQGNDTGLNLFTDPAFQQYTDLIALGHRMVAEESGTGSYTIVSHDTGQTVKKLVYWETVKLHDTAWRVMGALVIE
jgi:hypothetical protein